jgi:hypothetical protein
MMEALVVNMIFVIAFAGMVFFQATYSAKIKSLQNTRAYAWTYGLQGCNEVPEDDKIGVLANFGTPNGNIDSSNENVQSDLNDTGNTLPNTGTELDNDPTYTNNVFGTGQGYSKSPVGTVDATSSVQMASYNLIKVQGAVMTSSSHVQCNPTPVDETDIADVAIQAGRNLANW